MTDFRYETVNTMLEKIGNTLLEPSKMKRGIDRNIQYTLMNVTCVNSTYNNFIPVIDKALFSTAWIEYVITQLSAKNQWPQMKSFCLVAF